MKLFDLIHPAVTLGLALAFALFGMAWLGGLIGAVFFIAREHAQAEYRWIEHYGGGLRANLRPLSVLDPRLWNVHSLVFNLALPIAVALLVIVL
jgi:hypothetical protein